MAVTKKSLISSSPATSKISRAKSATPATSSVEATKMQTAVSMRTAKPTAIKAGVARIMTAKPTQVKTAFRPVN